MVHGLCVTVERVNVTKTKRRKIKKDRFVTGRLLGLGRAGGTRGSCIAASQCEALSVISGSKFIMLFLLCCLPKRPFGHSINRNILFRYASNAWIGVRIFFASGVYL